MEIIHIQEWIEMFPLNEVATEGLLLIIGIAAIIIFKIVLKRPEKKN